MEIYYKFQLHQFKELNKQIAAHLTRTKSITLTNEWRQRQHVRNY
jgi:hypothetical protein